VIEYLRSEGYRVFATVERFLSVFYGLTISYPHYRDPTVVDRMHFDAIVAARDVFPEHVASWEKLVGQGLCPIGEAFRENMTLVMSDAGVVYAGRDAVLLRVGSSGEDAIEALCAGEELRPLT
jgi:SUKH-3 immunity protein